MPVSAPRVCSTCGKRVPYGQRCECRRARRAEYDARRPSASKRGYTAEWQRESRAFLTLPENRYCCCGCGRYADMVDHRIPHRGDQALFWDRGNWQPMATHCHATRKQSAERRRRSPGVVETLAIGTLTGQGQPRDVFPKFSSPEKGQKA